LNLTPKNWGEFQHYKDRSPIWIKLHRTLLDNHDYYLLSAPAAKYLPLIWLLASEKDGMIPDTDRLAFRLRMRPDEALSITNELTERGFLVEAEAKPAEQGATLAQRIAKRNGFGSRHISDDVKRQVWERDGGKCCECGSDANIEYDHIHPISKGGNSDLDNIQLLCRPCNRSKRTKVATQGLGRRSLEKEKRKKRERKIATQLSDDFQPEEKHASSAGLSTQEAKREFEKFRNYAKSKGRVCIDWQAAWANWCIKAAEFMGRAPPPDPVKTAEIVGFYATFGSEQLDAWDKTKPGGYPRDKAGGWRFPSEWPPGHKQEAA
jgi:hypothetical protein